MFSFLRSIALPLPTFGIALPANIQRRFLSFVLKYFLGHLVKPGQLDDHKVDAQIGSGRVEIKDVELDDSVSCCCGPMSFYYHLHVVLFKGH